MTQSCQFRRPCMPMGAPEAHKNCGVSGDRGHAFSQTWEMTGARKGCRQRAIQAERPGEEPAEILGEEPSAVPEDVQEFAEEELLQASMAEQLVVNAHTGEQLSASASGSAVNSCQAAASKRASHRRLAAASLFKKANTAQHRSVC